MDGTFELNGVVTDSPGPLAGASGAGQLSIRDGTLPTLDLNRNLMRLARFTQLGPVAGDPSSFSRIESDFNIANQRITTEQLHVVGNGVEITAAGSIALAGAGNVGYEGTAKVDAGNNEVGNLIASLSGATFADGKLSFPFTLTGTLENPNFRLRSATSCAVCGTCSAATGSLTNPLSRNHNGYPSRARKGDCVIPLVPRETREA